MDDSLQRPRLRPVDAFPVDAGPRRLICLRDPLNITTRIVGLPPQTVFIVSMMDGEHDLMEIQCEHLKQFGEILPTPDLEQLIAELDQNLLLESAHFQRHLKSLEDAWAAASTRTPTHAGSGYDPDSEVLAARIEGYFLEREGPGKPPGGDPPSDRRLAGIIAPHIDFTRGGSTYAWAYRELLADSEADTFVVLGTSHAPLSRYFSVSRKHFDTPFGVLETDLDFLDQLEKRTGQPLESDSLVHRSEHSIELQSIWLRYLLRGRPCKIVPILCGALIPMIANGGSPRDEPEIVRFLDALRKTLADYDGRAVLIAAADLAHIGTGFGDPEPPAWTYMQAVEQADLKSLQACVALNGDGFFRQIQAEEDRRRICGLSPIYAFLESIEAGRGQLLKYRQCIDPSGFRNVTIASAAFYR